MTSTENIYRVTYRKADGRYYVDLDGVQVGWVVKDSHEKVWRFYATTTESLLGTVKATEPQRNIAVEEGLTNLGIYDLGTIYRLDMDRDSDTYMKDVPVYFDRDRISATVSHLVSVRYGLA